MDRWHDRGRQVRVADIRHLVNAAEFGGPGRVKDLYDWHRGRIGDNIKAISGAILSLIGSLVIALLKDEIKANMTDWHAWALGTGVGGGALYVGYLNWRLSRIAGEFATSLNLFRQWARQDPSFPEKGWS